MWHCNECGDDFEAPFVSDADDWDDYDGGTHYYVCPLCGGDDINEL